MQLPLNFPVFYYTVVKERLSLKQYDAINILIIGKPLAENTEYPISQSMATNYISGKKRINKDYIAAFLKLPTSEVTLRLKRIGLQNLDQSILCLKRMLYNRELTVSETDRSRLLHLVRNDKDQYDFLTEVFILAIKCPPQETRTLTEEERQAISIYQDPMLYGDIDSEISPEQIAESEKHLIINKTNKPKVSKKTNAFDAFNTAIYRTLALTMPDDYQNFRQFFYALIKKGREWDIDRRLSDFMRPYFERAIVHAITYEEIDFFFTPYDFNKFLPREDFRILCLLIESDPKEFDDYNEEFFHRNSLFEDVPIYYQEAKLEHEDYIRATLVLVSGDTR